VITGRLAVSDRIGGSGFQHRKVRREEEIRWLTEQGVNTILSFLAPGQNRTAYDAAGFAVLTHTVDGMPEEAEDIEAIFASMDEALAEPDAVVLIHRDTIDETLSGLLAGYLVYSGLVEDPIVATMTIEEILGRPLGPEGRRLIPAR
jgi:hypothetical protein